MKTIKFDKTDCGVDFLISTGSGRDKLDSFIDTEVYNTDFLQILFFKKASGHLILNQNRIDVHDNSIIFISPGQYMQWKLNPENLDFQFLIFQEDFLNDFFADKLFAYRLLYFYQTDFPLLYKTSAGRLNQIQELLDEIKEEIKSTKLDSEHIIRSLLYVILLKLNREYALSNGLPIEKPMNNYAYQYKKLIENHIVKQHRVDEYAKMLGISRITLNKAVKAQFNTSAKDLLSQRLLFEIKNYLIYSKLTINEIAYRLNFSEPQHLMRFFKAQTQLTTSQFLFDYQNGSI